MEALVQRMEDLAKSLGGPASARADAALSPTDRLAAMLKEALAANTIGGKVDDDSRLRAAAEEVRQAQASWSRIGPCRKRRAARWPIASSARSGAITDAAATGERVAAGGRVERAGGPGGRQVGPAQTAGRGELGYPT